jgi:hypothetical protein
MERISTGLLENYLFLIELQRHANRMDTERVVAQRVLVCRCSIADRSLEIEHLGTQRVEIRDLSGSFHAS